MSIQYQKYNVQDGSSVFLKNKQKGTYPTTYQEMIIASKKPPVSKLNQMRKVGVYEDFKLNIEGNDGKVKPKSSNDDNQHRNYIDNKAYFYDRTTIPSKDIKSVLPGFATGAVNRNQQIRNNYAILQQNVRREQSNTPKLMSMY